MTKHLNVGDAIRVATNWITTSDLTFSAAFIGGSMGHADLDSPFDPASDVDCYLVIDGDPPDGKIGKIKVDGVLLDVSWIPQSALDHAEADAVLATLLRYGRVVHDDGKLGPLQTRISANFVTPETMSERYRNIRAKIQAGLDVDSFHLPFPEQVMNWIFPATLATHVPLIGGCAPLTVRKRFQAARAVMMPHDYEMLLMLFGFDTVTKEQAQQWLDATARLFDATTGIAETSTRFWASDIQRDARHIAIDASQRMIDQGDHREALFWIIATSSRCLTVRADAGVSSVQYLREYWQMLRDLMLESDELRQLRTVAILDWI